MERHHCEQAKRQLDRVIKVLNQRKRMLSGISVVVLLCVLVIIAGCGNYRMVAAVQRGDLQTVENLVSKNPALVNAEDPGTEPGELRQSVLHSAIIYRHLDVAKYLVHMGADVNSKDMVGRTPLHVASAMGQAAIVKALLEKGANPNAHLNGAGTPLHSAAMMYGRIDAESYKASAEVVSILISNGADINITTSDSSLTPLHVATIWNRVAAMKLLLAAGADISVKDSNGMTALDIAEKESNTAATDLLLQYAKRQP